MMKCKKIQSYGLLPLSLINLKELDYRSKSGVALCLSNKLSSVSSYRHITVLIDGQIVHFYPYQRFEYSLIESD